MLYAHSKEDGLPKVSQTQLQHSDSETSRRLRRSSSRTPTFTTELRGWSRGYDTKRLIRNIEPQLDRVVIADLLRKKRVQVVGLVEVKDLR